MPRQSLWSWRLPKMRDDLQATPLRDPLPGNWLLTPLKNIVLGMFSNDFYRHRDQNARQYARNLSAIGSATNRNARNRNANWCAKTPTADLRLNAARARPGLSGSHPIYPSLRSLRTTHNAAHAEANEIIKNFFNEEWLERNKKIECIVELREIFLFI